MDIAPELVAHIARLSMLELDGEEARETAAELQRVLDYMAVLDRLDTEPMRPVSPVKNVLREDTPAPSMDRDELLAAAPAADGGTFLVPRAVE